MSDRRISTAPLVLISGDMTHIPPNPNLARWSTWMRAQSWSENTVNDRVSLIARVAATQGCEPEQLGEDDVLAFLSQSSLSGASKKTYHASLGAWFRWLLSTGRRHDNPMDGVPKPKCGRHDPKNLSAAHLELLLASRIHARTRTMILLGAYQGLRASEIAKVRGSDLDLISHEIRIVGKGDVEAVLPLHPLIEAEAGRYGRGWWFPQWTANRQTQTGGHILGPSVGTIVSAAMRRVGVPGSCHSLRRWHATALLRAGVDSRVTQELMRHASLSTTQLYLTVDDSQRRAGLLRLPDVTSLTLEAA